MRQCMENHVSCQNSCFTFLLAVHDLSSISHHWLHAKRHANVIMGDSVSHWTPSLSSLPPAEASGATNNHDGGSAPLRVSFIARLTSSSSQSAVGVSQRPQNSHMKLSMVHRATGASSGIDCRRQHVLYKWSVPFSGHISMYLVTSLYPPPLPSPPFTQSKNRRSSQITTTTFIIMVGFFCYFCPEFPMRWAGKI